MNGWADIMWSYPLLQTETHLVTIGQLIVAVITFLTGLYLSRGLAALVMRAPGPYAKGSNRRFAVRRLIVISGVFLSALVALPVSGIPLTLFAVVGGGLALGIGFGAQNLINNLISGFIILMERPVRVGDIVEVQGDRGRVLEVGNRCVHVRRVDGVHILVPNSNFLENTVVNWTLATNDIRGSVSVGVAYGSDVDLVRRLLSRIVQAMPETDDNRVPEVLFEDFGDSSLVFTVLFWTDVHAPIDLRRLQSNIRFEIDRCFRANDVVIAFPQLDIHISG